MKALAFLALCPPFDMMQPWNGAGRPPYLFGGLKMASHTSQDYHKQRQAEAAAQAAKDKGPSIKTVAIALAMLPVFTAVVLLGALRFIKHKEDTRQREDVQVTTPAAKGYPQKPPANATTDAPVQQGPVKQAVNHEPLKQEPPKPAPQTAAQTPAAPSAPQAPAAPPAPQAAATPPSAPAPVKSPPSDAFQNAGAALLKAYPVPGELPKAQVVEPARPAEPVAASAKTVGADKDKTPTSRQVLSAKVTENLTALPIANDNKAYSTLGFELPPGITVNLFAKVIDGGITFLVAGVPSGANENPYKAPPVLVRASGVGLPKESIASLKDFDFKGFVGPAPRSFSHPMPQ